MFVYLYCSPTPCFLPFLFFILLFYLFLLQHILLPPSLSPFSLTQTSLWSFAFPMNNWRGEKDAKLTSPSLFSTWALQLHRPLRSDSPALTMLARARIKIQQVMMKSASSTLGLLSFTRGERISILSARLAYACTNKASGCTPWSPSVYY